MFFASLFLLLFVEVDNNVYKVEQGSFNFFLKVIQGELLIGKNLPFFNIILIWVTVVYFDMLCLISYSNYPEMISFLLAAKLF